ncbi:uncharacterized protein LOC105639679 isoform X2 [Jatropha curcas]|uniref:uncharacterized protein LOC105639679 isoform X2 n=1 Tax=Jatropha curcas TaxID=180498 RepID=UPI0009D6A69B|nr:uncharacterized protein LOC105639679 isoform X2 [Jatropha curcas]
MRSMASSGSPKGIAAIVGVGPKLGRSIARKFAHEGYTVAILARDLGKLSRFADEIARQEKAQVFAIRIDCSDSRSFFRHSHRLLRKIPCCLLHRSPSLRPAGSSRNGGERKRDNFIHRMFSFLKWHCWFLRTITGCGKFALRGLAQCLAREFQPLGVHIAHVIIDGVVGPPRGPSSSQRTSVAEQQQQSGGGEMMDPDSLALTYWHLHVQDRTAWTQEIDLRPSNSIPRFC